MDITKNFKEYFPKISSQFSLKPFQLEVVDNIVNRKNNTISIMQTGGGKSLIFWLSGLSLKGITVVISPLIALIDEQATKLENEGCSVLKLHGGIQAKKQIEILTDFYNKKLNPDFLFVSPERLATDGFFEFCVKKRRTDIKLFVIDEIHCVSQWGFSFRPFYKSIPIFLNQVFNDSWPLILGLTATINPKELQDISKEFKISYNNILKDEILTRPEIELIVEKTTDENKKEIRFWELLDIHRDEKTLVYLYRKYYKRGTEELLEKALEKGHKAMNFHGDMSGKERQDIITEFKTGSKNLIIATNAFGMGIDIPDIKNIIHFMLPESVEQYYQEIGRAAREDNSSGRAYLFYSNKNVQVKRTHFINKSFPNIEDIKKIHKNITSKGKIGKLTFKYFQNEEAQSVFSYLLDNSVININYKGFTSLRDISEIKDTELLKLYDSTKSKGIIAISEKNNIEPKQIINKVYKAIVESKVKVAKFDKALILENFYTGIPQEIIDKIETEVEEKKKYKNDLLTYFVYLLDNYTRSNEFHQEIGLYIGVPKHKLNRIYKTQKGDFVISKSEVIIANILFTSNIQYDYEQKLYYNAKDYILPDFTISHNGKTYYWEHLGLIGIENYDKRWIKKKKIYSEYFPDQLIITYEDVLLTGNANKKINEIKAE